MEKIVQGELIHLVGEYMAIRLQIPDFDVGEQEIDNLNVIIAIDRSGSMAGLPISDAKGATLSLIQKFKKTNIPVTLYLFNNRFTSFSSHEIGYSEVNKAAENLSALGGTLFAPVITDIHNTIINQQMKGVFCIWLSDGQDNDGLAQLIPIMDYFKSDMERSGVSIAVHSIGFSEGHDAQLLTALSQSGTKPGSFQYVPPGGRIPVAVNNVYELAFESAIWARFISQENKTCYKISIEKNLKSGMFDGLLYISENDLEDCKIEVHKGSHIRNYDLEYTRCDVDDFKELVHLVTSFVSKKIINILESRDGNQRENLSAIYHLIEEMDRRIDNLTLESRRLRIFMRKSCNTFFSAAKVLFDCYYQIIKETAGGLSNLQLAQLNNHAHKLILLKGLEKKIAKENKENIQMLNQTELKIDEILRNLNVQELQKKYNDVEQYGNCIVSRKTWIDCLIEGDCLCLTFELERPLDLLGVANLIKIKKIYTYVASADSFIDSKLFETKAGQIIQAERSYKHNERPKKADSLIKGLPNEVINGILPLYINEDHWQVAKEKIKPIIGWNVTIDVLGYKEGQLREFPYMIYAKLLEEAQTNYQFFQLNLVKETCLAVYRDDKEYNLHKLKVQFEEYLTDAGSRLKENIPNNYVFLSQLLCPHETGDFQKSEILFPYLFEEEFRRKIVFPAKITFWEFATKMLDININELIQKDISEGFAGSGFYAQKFLSALEKDSHDLHHNLSGRKFEFEFTGRIENFSKRAMNFVDKIVEQMKKGGILYKILHLMSQFGFPAYTSLESLGLVTNEQKLALIFQSIRDKKEVDRKSAIIRKEYVNIFDPEASLVYIQKLYSQVVRREITNNRNLSKIHGNLKDSQDKALAFACTLSLEEAAGLLIGLISGSNEFPLFYKELIKPYSTLPAQKMAMITSGHFRGVKLIVNSKNTTEFVT